MDHPVTDPTLRIKNLSIALEALSCINISGSLELYATIERALWEETKALQKENQWPQRPAKPYHDYTKDPFTNPDDNDEL